MWHECKSLHDVCVCVCVHSPNNAGSLDSLDDQTETESVVSFRRERPRPRESLDQHGLFCLLWFIFVRYLNSLSVHWQSSPCSFCCTLSVFVSGPRMNGQSRMDRHLAGYESATTVMSSELDTTSFCDSDEDDTMSRSEQVSFLLF